MNLIITTLDNFSTLTKISAAYGVGLWAIAFFQWRLVEYLTPFLMVPLFLLLLTGLVVLIVASMVYFFLNRRQIGLAARPLLVNIGTILVLYFVPFTAIWLALEFRAKLDGYEEVVALVETGRIRPDESGHVRLPPEYRHLSQDGRIVVDSSDGTLSVFFYTFVGVLDNFSGYMYRANDTPPGEGIAGGDWQQIKRERAHWFFCAST